MYQPSTPPPVTPHVGRTALTYGVSAGLILGITQSAITLYTAHASYGTLSELSGPFGLLLWIVVFLFIGALAGKRTGKTSTGTLTGLWAGIIGGLISAVTAFGVLMTEIDQNYSNASIVALYLTLMILGVLVSMGIGTGLGALGGLIGQSFSTPSTPYQQYRQSDPPQAETE